MPFSMTASGALERLTGAWRRSDPGLVRLTRAAGGLGGVVVAEALLHLAAAFGLVALSPLLEMAAGLACVVVHVFVKWPLRRSTLHWHLAALGVLLAAQVVSSLGQDHPLALHALLLVLVVGGFSLRRWNEPFTSAGMGMLIVFMSNLFSPAQPALLPELMAASAVGWAVALGVRLVLPPPSPRRALGDQVQACRATIREGVALLPALLAAPTDAAIGAGAQKFLRRLTLARLALTTLAGSGDYAGVGREIALRVHEIETSLVIVVEVLGLESVISADRPRAWPEPLKGALAAYIRALNRHLAARGSVEEWHAARREGDEWLVAAAGDEETSAVWFFRAARVMAALSRVGEAAALAHEALS